MEDAGLQATRQAKQKQAKGVKVRLWGTPTLGPSRAPAGHRGLGRALFTHQGPSRTQGPGKSPFYLKPSSSALGLAPTPPQFLSGEVLKPGLVGSL